jgi:hypothetical protein
VEVTFCSKGKEKRALHLLRAMAMFLDFLTLCSPCAFNTRAARPPCAGRGSQNVTAPILFIPFAFPLVLWTMERMV